MCQISCAGVLLLLCWDAESLELRIVEALTAAYPKPLNGAQLAKLCGHFKLKSKVGQLLVASWREHRAFLTGCNPLCHRLQSPMF